MVRFAVIFYVKNSDALTTLTLQNLLIAAKSFQFSVTTVAFQRRALAAIRASRAKRCATPGASRGNLPLLTRHGSDGIAWMSE